MVLKVNRQLLARNRYFLALDVLGWSILPLVALGLRLDGLAGLASYGSHLAVFSGLAVICKGAVSHSLGIYSKYWLYASAEDFATVGVAALLGSTATFLVYSGLVFAVQVSGEVLPRSIPVIDFLLSALFAVSLRSSARLGSGFNRRRGHNGKRRRVLVVGAGDAGALIAQELKSNGDLGMAPIGFVDDDPHKQAHTISGVPVLGAIDEIESVIKQHHIEAAVIAIPSGSGALIRRVRDLCDKAGIEAKTVPSLSDLIAGRVRVSELREVRIEDLLRREPVRIDEALVKETVAGETVLVTGAGGSIGSEICRQLVRLGVERLALIDRNENSVFRIYEELKFQNGAEIEPWIVDVRDAVAVERLFSDLDPAIVFHAAAHKHVPLLERNAEEAVRNNIGGTLTVLDAAERVGVERFVLISTDKAVSPSNVMGATKLVCEWLVTEVANKLQLPYVSVRFGNVLGSSGSVVPLFKEQIAAGGPVRVTHPEMSRYFMTIPEAVLLVLQAAAMGRSGETFVLDMGEPVRIVDLAHDLIQLSGLVVGSDVEVVFTGRRPGEKLAEQLFSESESSSETEHAKILVVSNGVGNVNGQAWRTEMIQAVRNGAIGEALELMRAHIVTSDAADA